MARESKLVRLMKKTDKLEAEYKQARRELRDAIISLQHTTLHTPEHEQARQDYCAAWKRKDKASAKLRKAYEELNKHNK